MLKKYCKKRWELLHMQSHADFTLVLRSVRKSLAVILVCLLTHPKIQGHMFRYGGVGKS